MLLVDCPVNSTQVDNSSARTSHPNLELSRIDIPGGRVVDSVEVPCGDSVHQGAGSRDVTEAVHMDAGGAIGDVVAIVDMSLTGAGGVDVTVPTETCTRPSSNASKSVVFTCPDCQRQFKEKRYLNQHIGKQKCKQRKNFLEKTSANSFTLALTDTPGSTRNSSTSGSDQVILLVNLNHVDNIQFSGSLQFL